MKHFHVVTLFPEMVENAARVGVVGGALGDGKLRLETMNPRIFTSDVHQTVDDRPFGGGDGMIMMAEPCAQAVDAIRARIPEGDRAITIHFSPRGRPLTDAVVREYSSGEHFILIASRYGGLDQRFINAYVDEEISIGDFILSGGEIPALAFVDAVGRLEPGVLGNRASASDESFQIHGGCLEHPQYTRPREWRGTEVPNELLSGNHAAIQAWKRNLSLLVTLDRRPDLRPSAMSARDISQALAALKKMSATELAAVGLEHAGLVEERLNEMARRGKI